MDSEQFTDYDYLQKVRESQGKSTEEMVVEICKFRAMYESIKEDKGVKEKIHKLEVRYFVTIQKEQNFGVNDEGATAKIVESLDKAMAQEDEDMDDFATTLTKIVNREYRKTSKSNSKSELETASLYAGYRWLMSPIENKKLTGRFLCSKDISKLHELLMDGIIEHPFKAGQFTNVSRWTRVKGAILEYHEFKSEEEVKLVLDKLFDGYNNAVAKIISTGDDKEMIKGLFKCAAKVLFGFGLIHPFPDGNGRTARLIVNYCLSLIAPFPTPVYNVCSPSTRNEFVVSLMEARKWGKDGEDSLEGLIQKFQQAKPEKLCAILIEANWHMWERFLSDVMVPGTSGK